MEKSGTDGSVGRAVEVLQELQPYQVGKWPDDYQFQKNRDTRTSEACSNHGMVITEVQLRSMHEPFYRTLCHRLSLFGLASKRTRSLAVSPWRDS